MTTMISGMYRKAYPASAADHKPKRRLRTRLPHARGRTETAASDPRRQPCQYQCGDGQYDRQHAAERPVARFQELLLDHVANQTVPGSAKDIGDSEDAQCRDEYQCGPSVDTGQRQWESDSPETLPGVRAQILGRVEQRLIMFLEIRI